MSRSESGKKSKGKIKEDESMSNKLRKVLAAILAGTMVLGSGVVANAAGGESTGEGTLDQVKDKEVFSVVLPTTQETANIFDYILDPTGVIAQTNAEKYSKTATASFTPGKTMYFKNAPAFGSTTIPYTDESDPITAYNKSNIDVEISVEASIATPSGIDLSSTSVATASVASPSMFIGVKASGSDTVNPITTQTKQVIATSSIASASEAYKIKYNEADDEYKLVLKDNVKDLKPTDAAFATTFESYSFVLTGDCSKAGDWKTVTEVPAVSLVWTIEKPTGAVEAESGPKVTLGTDGVIRITNLDGTKWGSMSLNDGTQDWPLTTGTDGTWVWEEPENGKKEFTLASNWMPDYLKGKTAVVKITLNDDTVLESAPVTFPN